MEARPCQIQEFFNGTKQLLIPLFQRPYEWKEKEWGVLWDDILEQYEKFDDGPVASHFTGAIVTAPVNSVPVGVSKFLVIDGQQRLTTFAVIICALKSFFEQGSKDYNKLIKLLINEDEDNEDYYKILPTQLDRAGYKNLIDQTYQDQDNFSQSYAFFRQKIAGSDSNGIPIDVKKLINTINTKITVIAIHLGESDDPYLIFESLNAKGAPLTSADLIRNYLLLRLHTNHQEDVYKETWLPMQKRLHGEQLSEFMRQFLMLEGTEVSKSSIYTVLKERLKKYHELAIVEEMRRMERLSVLYAQIIGEIENGNVAISVGLERLRRWDVATANTLILKILELHSNDKISTDEVIACLDTIESFVVRRAVCGVPTNQLKRIFLAINKDLPQTDISSWLVKMFSSGGSGARWPKDDEFKEALTRFRAYAHPLDRCKFILENVESAHGHKELVAFKAATIEHVMPQTISDDWRIMLGENATEIHEKWLDVLGNLTLTGYNSELSNYPFEKKKGLLAESHFEMNKWISTHEKWTSVEMKKRSDTIFEVIKDVWVGPAIAEGS